MSEYWTISETGDFGDYSEYFDNRDEAVEFGVAETGGSFFFIGCIDVTSIECVDMDYKKGES